MKLNCWLIIGAMLSTRLLAQQVTNAPSAAPIETPIPAPALTNEAAPAPAPTPEVAPAPATNAPAAKPAKKKKAEQKKKKADKKVAKKKAAAAELKTVPLEPGPATVVASHVNVRGQAKLKSEVVSHLTNGQPVTVIQEIVRNDSAADEPSAWAKILLPPDSHVWVNTAFLNADKTVKPKKLNVRSGPGENYSVLGTLVRGESVTEVTTKGDWTEINAPTNAYAFVAAQYLKQGVAAPVETPATPASPESTNAVAEAPAIASAPTNAPAIPESTNAVAEASTNAPAVTNAPAEIASATTNAPAAEEPPPKRIVEREGIVKGTVSIQAPTKFALYSPDNGSMIDYLYTTSADLDLRRYKGLRIVVTGEEGLEERWGNTPVITIQKIQVVE